MIGFVKMRQLEVDDDFSLRGHVLEHAIEVSPCQYLFFHFFNIFVFMRVSETRIYKSCSLILENAICRIVYCDVVCVNIATNLATQLNVINVRTDFLLYEGILTAVKCYQCQD